MAFNNSFTPLTKRRGISALNTNSQNISSNMNNTSKGVSNLGSNLNSPTTILGKLFVGSIYMPAIVIIYATITFFGNFIVNGNVNINGTLTVTGKTIIDNELEVTGATTLHDTLTVDGITTLHSDLTVDGNTTLHGDLTVEGETKLDETLTVTGSTTLNDTLNVVSATFLHNTLEVDNATILNNTLDVISATTLHYTLDVIGATTLHDTLNVNSDVVLASDNDASTKIYGAIFDGSDITSDTVLTLHNSGNMLLINSTSGAITIQLPTTNLSNGVNYKFCLSNNTTNNIVINTGKTMKGVIITSSGVNKINNIHSKINYVANIAQEGDMIEMFYVNNVWLTKAVTSSINGITTSV